jgi:hypothetical protein
MRYVSSLRTHPIRIKIDAGMKMMRNKNESLNIHHCNKSLVCWLRMAMFDTGIVRAVGVIRVLFCVITE